MSWTKRGGVLLGLAVSLGLCAWGWQGVPTDRLFVLVPDGIPNPVEVAALAEGILQEVWALWLPQARL